jgi:uncharacterized protein YacL
MPSKFISLLILTANFIFSLWIGLQITTEIHFVLFFGAGGLLVGAVFLRFLRSLISIDLYTIVGAVLGFVLALTSAFIATMTLFYAGLRPEWLLPTSFLLMLVFSGICIQLGMAKSKELRRKLETGAVPGPRTVGILDTSVIIDGRIADVCETGFIDGDLIIPQFVLKELQSIADSSETTKRTRGRRGLDILNKIKKQSFVKIIIEDVDFPSIKEVDQKLIQMAKETGYSIITNDFNLNKVAEVQSIQVLNINQLANSLKPIVLPGELMRVQILKEGKEHGQGVAYLDDGTMVVVDNGKRHIGRTMEVTVTSVLQSTAGRMIFAIAKF